MEKIQGQNKLCSLDQNLSLGVQGSVEDQSFVIEEEQFSSRSLQDTTIPFLQMLQQSEDPCSFFSLKDPNFLALLSLQTLEKPWELERYLLHETNHYYHNPSLEGIKTSQELRLNPLERKNNSLTGEKRKRKRRITKPTKNIQEVESQRMTHIAVERNRRRQMNVHLNSLRSLIPPSYIQRGDQASVVGGAIDFVKILEQRLQSLEAQKMTQQSYNNLRDISSNKLRASREEQLKIEATVIESHVNLKIQCLRKQGQLIRSIILLEKLRFTILHLNVTSPSTTSVSKRCLIPLRDSFY